MKINKGHIQSFVGTSALQVIAKLIGAMLSILLARNLGPEQFGNYGLIMATIAIMLIPASGMMNVVIREGAKLISEGHVLNIEELERWFNTCLLVISFFISIILLFLYLMNQVTEYVLLISIVVLLRGMLIKFSAFLNAKERPMLTQFPQNIFVPLINIALILIISKLSDGLSLDIVIKIYVTTLIFSYLLSTKLCNQSVKIKTGFKSLSKFSEWNKSGMKFMMIAFVGLAGSEGFTLILGYFSSSEEVGYLRVALQILSILSLGFYSVNVVFGPKISKAYCDPNSNFQEVIKSSVRLSCISTLPIIGIVALFSDDLVVWMFGGEYEKAANIILVLCIGQTVNVLCGSVGLILNMTGNEKATLYIQCISLFISLMVIHPLITQFGSLGVAYAMTFNMIIWNILMCYYIRSKLGIISWIR